eukprot:scaffold48287_cov31-Prasinocladus_malaysianus.AAC.1
MPNSGKRKGPIVEETENNIEIYGSIRQINITYTGAYKSVLVSERVRSFAILRVLKSLAFSNRRERVRINVLRAGKGLQN